MVQGSRVFGGSGLLRVFRVVGVLGYLMFRAAARPRSDIRAPPVVEQRFGHWEVSE